MQCNATYFVADACVAFSLDTVFEENVAALTVCVRNSYRIME